mmetsp:Transcript_38327/g.109972  ORF Transcript_38327/g.109972 Transcript_38327/m.109972 type:complete len:341 (+) Transcript_38327:3-1025(+)
MLLDSLPSCLGVPRSDRHAYLEEVVDMVGELLEGLESRAKDRAHSAEAVLSEAAADHAEACAARDAALAKVEAHSKDVAGCRAVLHGPGGAVERRRATEKRLELREEEQRRGEEQIVAQASLKKSVVEALAEDGELARLVAESEASRRRASQAGEGATAASEAAAEAPAESAASECADWAGGEAARRRILAGEMATLARACGVDDSLVCAIPGAFAKPAGALSAFDIVVLQQLTRGLEAHARSLDERLAETEPTRRALEAGVASERGPRAEAEVAEGFANAKLTEAEEAQRAAEIAVKGCVQAVAKASARVDAQRAEFAVAEAALASLRAGPLDAFGKFR